MVCMHRPSLTLSSNRKAGRPRICHRCVEPGEGEGQSQQLSRYPFHEHTITAQPSDTRHSHSTPRLHAQALAKLEAEYAAKKEALLLQMAPVAVE